MTHFTACEVVPGANTENRRAWLAARQSMVTASESAVLFDAYPFDLDAFGLFQAKTMPVNDYAPTPWEPMFWGAVMEQPALRAIARYNQWDYEPGGELLRSKAHPILGATLDGEIDRHDGLGWVDFEGKMSEVTQAWNEDEGKAPPHVVIQAQHQMLVSGSPVAVVFALLQRCRPCTIEVEPDPPFQRMIVERSEAFVELVRRLEPPPPTAKSTDLLKRLYPEDDGSITNLPPEAVEWTEELLQLGEEIKALVNRKDELRNRLRAAMKKCRYGMLPMPVDGYQLWREQSQEKAGYWVEASTSRPLIAMKQAPWERRNRAASVVRVRAGESGEMITRFGRRRASRR